MVRAITRDDVIEVRNLGITIETVAGHKGASVIKGIIDEAVKSGVTLVCIGGNATGKSTALKAILGTIPNWYDGAAVDGLKSEHDVKLLKNGGVKYAVLHANDEREAYNIITCGASDVVPNTLLIELALDCNGNKVVKGVYEIIVIDNGKSNALIPLVDIHKEKFRKVNDLYL